MIRSLLDPYLSQTLDQYGATPPLAAKPPGPGLLGGSFGRGPGGNNLTGFGSGATLNVNQGDRAPAPGAPNNVGTLPPTEPSVAFRNALLAGGQAAARAPAYDSVGSSLASALANGLTSGAQSFVATRDAEKDRDYQMKLLAQQKAESDAAIASLPIPNDQKQYLMSLPQAKAAELIAPFLAPPPAAKYTQGTMGVVQTEGEGAGRVAVEAPKAPEKKPDNTSDYKNFLATNGLDADTQPSDLTPEAGRAFAAFVAASDRAKGTNIINNLGESASKIVVNKSFENLMKMKEDVVVARTDAAAGRQQLELIKGPLGDDKGTINGSLAPARIAIATFISTATGIPNDQLAATNAYGATAMTRALPYIRLLAPVTDTDYKAMINWKGGQGSFPAASARRIIEADLKLSKILEKRYNERIAGPEGRLLPEDVRGILTLPPDDSAAEPEAPKAAPLAPPKDGEVVGKHKWNAKYQRWEIL